MSIYDKLGAKTAGIKARAVEKTADKSPRTAPAMFLDAAQRMDAAEARVEELEARLRLAEASASQFEIALDQLHEVSGRRRRLSAEEYAELRDNLRNNDLVTPITVRPRTEGGYEVISGHNRVNVFRELGRTSIAAVVQDTEATQADINAFYANLLQPDLPDYEKFLGFCMIQDRRPAMSHEEIADMVGVSRSQITKLMAFAGLPKAAHALLREHIAAIGANAALELARLTREGRGKEVTEAIEKVVAGEFDQSQAIRFASVKVDKPKSTKPEPVTVRSGKSVYCALRRADKVIRLEFKSAEEAEAIQQAITQILEMRAAQLKPDKT
jgi:ParB family chromosome partitioning protein